MISKRLSTIIDLIAPGNSVADIGSDHCLLPIALAHRGDCPYLQAIDNKKGPYLHMEEAVRKEGLLDAIDLSLSSGLTCLDPRVDTLVLAGMGGRLAVDILYEGSDKLGPINTILIDPHRDLSYTRSSLVKLGYYIEQEKVVFENDVYYFIIRFQKGKAPDYTVEDLLFGPVARKERSKEFLDFLYDQKKRIKKILSKPLSVEAGVKYRKSLDYVNAEIARR